MRNLIERLRGLHPIEPSNIILVCEEAADELEAKDKRIAELESALRDVFVLIDEGFLCRDISRDAESGWAIRQLRFVQRLAKAKQALGADDE